MQPHPMAVPMVGQVAKPAEVGLSTESGCVQVCIQPAASTSHPTVFSCLSPTGHCQEVTPCPCQMSVGSGSRPPRASGPSLGYRDPALALALSHSQAPVGPLCLPMPFLQLAWLETGVGPTPSAVDQAGTMITTVTKVSREIMKNQLPLSGKEPACNAGDTCVIPGSGRFPGEGK